jgi:hypothetical protein
MLQGVLSCCPLDSLVLSIFRLSSSIFDLLDFEPGNDPCLCNVDPWCIWYILPIKMHSLHLASISISWFMLSNTDACKKWWQPIITTHHDTAEWLLFVHHRSISHSKKATMIVIYYWYMIRLISIYDDCQSWYRSVIHSTNGLYHRFTSWPAFYISFNK